MLSRILPATADNRYRGHALALWLFVPIVLMRVAISCVHVFYADGGMQSVSTMPLDAYAPGAAQNIVGLAARMGVEQLLACALFLVALLRYRSLLPLMYLMIVAQYAVEDVVVRMKPLALSGASGARGPALVLMLASIAGLLLASTGRRYREGAQPALAH